MRLFALLRIYRAFKGLPLKAVADEMGISPRQLSSIEDGKMPDGETLAKITVWIWGSDEPKAAEKPKQKEMEV